LEVNFFQITVPGQSRSQVIFPIEEPGVTRVGREQRERANRHPASIVLGCAALDITDFLSKLKILALNVPLTQSALDGFPSH
jgi:hypothetical protein